MPLRRSVQAVAQALSERRLADAVWYDNTARQRKRGVGEHAGSGCRGLLALRGGGRPGLARSHLRKSFLYLSAFPMARCRNEGDLPTRFEESVAGKGAALRGVVVRTWCTSQRARRSRGDPNSYIIFRTAQIALSFHQA